MALLSRKKKLREQTRISFPPVLKKQAKQDGPYAIWVRNHRWTERNETWCRDRLQKFSYKPAVGILMQCTNPKEEFLIESFSSIFNQIYPFQELSIVDRGSRDPRIRMLLQEVEKDSRVKVSYQKGSERDIEAIARIMKKAQSEWILLMGAEDVLEPNAVYNMIGVLQDAVEIDFVFSDSDLIDDAGLRFDPQFKPIWAVGAHYPLGYYQHPVLLSRRLVEKLKGYERASALMEEGSLLDEASNHSRYVLKAPGVLYHARARGLKNENPPEPTDNVLMNDNLVSQNGVIQIRADCRVRAEPKVPLNILWAVDSLDQDDGPTLWFHFLRYLARESGHRFTVVSLKDGFFKTWYRKICPAVVVSETQEGLTESIPKLHTDSTFDVAFVSGVGRCWFPEILQPLDIPAVWQLFPGSNPETAESRESLRKLFEYPATIVFLNSAFAGRHQELDLRNVSRILPAAVDHADVKLFKQRNSPFDWRAKLGVSQSTRIFTIVGPTMERKDQVTFVTAALQMLKKNPDQELVFFIAGERQGAYLDEIRQMIRRSGKENHFRLFPETSDVYQYYPYYLVTDCLISCSIEEMFPLSVLEAMSMKKAVLGTDVFGTNEVLEHDENGFLFSPKDPYALAENMDFLLNKPEFFDFFGRRSLEIIYERFQMKKIAARLEDLLRESIVYEKF
jgi:glycosyltransferase involved in cell wall biosynthesis